MVNKVYICEVKEMINRVTDNKFKLVSKYQPSQGSSQAIEQLVGNIEELEKRNWKS